MPVKTYAKTLLLIGLMSFGMAAFAQDSMIVTRNLSYSRFGVPVITEETGDGLLMIYYVVEPGNTLYSISRQFDLSVPDIREMNELNSNVIYTRQKLLVRKEELPQGGFATEEKMPRQLEFVPQPAPIRENTPPKQEVEKPSKPIPKNDELIIIDNFDETPKKEKEVQFGQ